MRQPVKSKGRAGHEAGRHARRAADDSQKKNAGNPKKRVDAQIGI